MGRRATATAGERNDGDHDGNSQNQRSGDKPPATCESSALLLAPCLQGGAPGVRFLAPLCVPARHPRSGSW